MPTSNHSNNFNHYPHFQGTRQVGPGQIITSKTLFCLLILVLVLFPSLAACANSSTRSVPTPATPASSPTATSALVLTPAPGIAATVTAVHKLPVLPSEQARPYLEIRELVLVCNELRPNRRIMILQHLEWLTHPNQTPPEFISLYGDDVSGQLVFGAAYTVAVEWKAGGRQANSCLIPIGDQFNSVLINLGRPPMPEFAN